MTQIVSRNLSHRHLIKQCTKQLFYYPKVTARASKVVEIKPLKRTRDASKCVNEHDTSILLDSETDPSVAKKYSPRYKSLPRNHVGQLSNEKRSYVIRARPNIKKCKSLQSLNKKKAYSMDQKQAIDNLRREKQVMKSDLPKFYSIENIEVNEEYRNLNETHKGPKTEQDIKHNLRKVTASRLKLKVVDPFEKRTKLEQEFHNQSVIGKTRESFISTANQQELQQMLGKIK